MSAVLTARADDIPWTKVRSSNIDAAGYDEAFDRLYVLFLSGSCYVYSGVGRGAWEDLLAAPSKGAYVHDEIRGAGGKRGRGVALDAKFAVVGPLWGVRPNYAAAARPD